MKETQYRIALVFDLVEGLLATWLATLRVIVSLFLNFFIHQKETRRILRAVEQYSNYQDEELDPQMKAFIEANAEKLKKDLGQGGMWKNTENGWMMDWDKNEPT